MQNEKQIVRRIQNGDGQAFAQVVDAYGPQIHRLVRRYVANPADAEDVTQEIFCEAYRSLGGFRGECALMTWMYRLAARRCLRHCKRQTPDHLPLDEQVMETLSSGEDERGNPMRAALRGELSDQVQTALSRLSALHYDVVVLCELHGLTYQECATALEIPVGTVKSRLSTAFRRLRESLGAYVLNAPEPLCADGRGGPTP